MPIIDVPQMALPDFHDLASSLSSEGAIQSAQAAIDAAQSRIDDEWALWSALAIADILRRHPTVAALSVPGSTSWVHLEARIHVTPEDARRGPHGASTYFAAMMPTDRAAAWNPPELADIKGADREFHAWGLRRSFKAFLRLVRARWGTAGTELHLGHDEPLEKQLLSWLGRPQLWLQLETRALAATALQGAHAAARRI